MVEFIEKADLTKYCTIRIGGIAEKIYFPKTPEEIAYLIKLAMDKNKKLIPVGIGSNIVFRDGVIDNILVSTFKMRNLKLTEKSKDEVYLEAEAGVSFKTIVNLVKKHNLEGFENLSGIPASIGGAITMNAGAFGSEIFDLVERVYWINKNGDLIVSEKKDINFSYRKTQFHKEGFVYKAVLKLKKSDKNIAGIIKQHLLERNRKQPLNLPTCGSTFKNPKNTYAGKLLEEVGLKGFRINDVGFSEKHANFSVNYGSGTYKDFRKLLDTAKEKVLKEFNIQLEEEVQTIS